MSGISLVGGRLTSEPSPTNAYLPDRNPRKIESDYISPNRPQPHPFEWVCIYCYGLNHNRTLECRFCHALPSRWKG